MALELAKRQIIYAIAKAMDKYETNYASFDWNSYDRDADIPNFNWNYINHKLLAVGYPDLEKWSLPIETMAIAIGFKVNHIDIKASDSDIRLKTLENIYKAVYNQIWDGEDEDEDGEDSLMVWADEYVEKYGNTL